VSCLTGHLSPLFSALFPFFRIGLLGPKCSFFREEILCHCTNISAAAISNLNENDRDMGTLDDLVNPIYSIPNSVIDAIFVRLIRIFKRMHFC